VLTVETFLFYDCDRRRVLPGRMCDTQTQNAINRHV